MGFTLEFVFALSGLTVDCCPTSLKFNMFFFFNLTFCIFVKEFESNCCTNLHNVTTKNKLKLTLTFLCFDGYFKKISE